MTGKIFDGDTDYRNSMHLETQGTRSIFKAFLGKVYSIQYVVIFHGEG